VLYWELPNSFRLYISEGAGNSVIVAELPAGYHDPDGDWHFFSFRYDYSLGSDNLKVTRDNDVSTLEEYDNGSGTPNSGDAFNPLAFQHKGATTQETYIPDANNTTELSIWDRVLTDAEVTMIYNSGAGFDLITGAKVWVEKGTA